MDLLLRFAVGFMVGFVVTSLVFIFVAWMRDEL